jgi:hypothetical protein
MATLALLVLLNFMTAATNAHTQYGDPAAPLPLGYRVDEEELEKEGKGRCWVHLIS